jgi:LacI family transcriptional regulator
MRDTQRRLAVRIVDVAGRAGVSTATVSRVLNGTAPVPEPTRTRVLDAIRETGFVRNAVAGQLAGGRSNSVGVIVPTLTNPIFAESIHYIIAELDKERISPFVGTHEYSLERETQMIRRLLEWRVDGLLLTGTARSKDSEEMLLASGRPFLTMWVYDKRRGRPTVSFDNEVAARAMTDHLIKLGHRRIAFVSPSTENNDRTAQRQNGYCAALSAAGIAINNAWILD